MTGLPNHSRTDDPLDVLVLETFSWSPHLETAGEIALCGTRAGTRTAFLFLQTPNPDESIAVTHPITLGLWSRRNKVRQLEQSLIKNGVDILEQPVLEKGARERIAAFVRNAPSTTSELRTYCYGEALLGSGVTSSLVAGTLLPYPDPTAFWPMAMQYLSAAAMCFELATTVIRERRPRRVVTFNGRFATCVGVAEAARLLGVDVRYHERGATIDRYGLYPGAPQDPRVLRAEVERYWTEAGPNRDEIAADFYRRRRQGDGIGWFSYVEHHQPGNLPIVSPHKRQLVYFTSGDTELEFPGCRPHGRIFANQREGAQYLMAWVARQTDCELTIRVHPGTADLHPDERNWWHSLRGENTIVVSAESTVDSYGLMDRANTVLSSGSTMGIEATFAGKPSILLTEATYSGFGCVHEPMAVHELQQLLENDSLAALPRAACFPYGYYGATYGIPYQFYQASTPVTGRFLGLPLGYEREWLRSTTLLRVARAAWRAIR